VFGCIVDHITHLEELVGQLLKDQLSRLSQECGIWASVLGCLLSVLAWRMATGARSAATQARDVAKREALADAVGALLPWAERLQEAAARRHPSLYDTIGRELAYSLEALAKQRAEELGPRRPRLDEAGWTLKSSLERLPGKGHIGAASEAAGAMKDASNTVREALNEVHQDLEAEAEKLREERPSGWRIMASSVRRCYSRLRTGR